jgi:hypothetical protein
MVAQRRLRIRRIGMAGERGMQRKEAFLKDLFRRQEALWAVLCHAEILPEFDQGYDFGRDWTSVTLHLYLPATLNGLDVATWRNTHQKEIETTIATAATAAYEVDNAGATWHWIIPVPKELAELVAKNTRRPMPRRFDNSVVPMKDKDGVTWLTPAEVPLYDTMKEAGWTFIPQPPVVSRDVIRIPDFMLFWEGRADQAVMIEVDSDLYHGKPSQRERDELKERDFESMRFLYLRFSGLSCMDDPAEVVAEIKRHCERRFAR